MRLLFIRHGEPDYEHDCLTENGVIQAQKLRERLDKTENVAAAYLSSMGRAQQTGRIFLKGKIIPAKTCDWLREFDVKVSDPDWPDPVPVWDLYPKNWTEISGYYDRKAFADVPAVKQSELVKRYTAACEGLDEVLAVNGLRREGGVYVKTDSHDKTIAFFCHFGITCVIISYLLGVSPVIMLQGLSAEPTAVATLCTDDRFGDKVNFRLHGFGDISHLGNVADSGINYK